MIYFIRSYNEFIKIGQSAHLGKRLKSLQTASPKKLHVTAILSGSFQTEAGLHEMFSHLRVHGEWFRFSQELKWFIRAIQENPEMNNIRSLRVESLKMRINAKAKRLGSQHKLTKRISEV